MLIVMKTWMEPDLGSPDGRRGPPPVADDKVIDDRYVIIRLEEAGATLLALPQTGYSTRLRTSSLDIVRTAMEVYGQDPKRAYAPVPSARRIDEMEQALSWITRIAIDRHVLRRVVGARSIVSPLTGRHIFTWRRLAASLGADHKAVQRWHAQGIGLIVASLILEPK